MVNVAVIGPVRCVGPGGTTTVRGRLLLVGPWVCMGLLNRAVVAVDLLYLFVCVYGGLVTR